MSKVENITLGNTPLRDHHIVTGNDGTKSLVSYGAVVAIVLPSGVFVLPPDWQDANRTAQRHRRGFLDMTVGELREAVRYSSPLVTVSLVPLELPVAWLERFGPASPNPYTT